MAISLFAHQLKLEDVEGNDFPEGNLITEGDEGESVAAAVAEITEEEAGVEEAEREAEQLSEDGEQLEDLQEAVEVEAPKTEHAGLTATNARLLNVVASRILGKEYTRRKFPNMESYGSRADARSATSYVQEGIGDALRSFWDALKAQFKKIWTKMKTWGIKTFSSAGKLAERAKQIRSRAETMSSTIENKSFQFGQVKTLAVDGKLKDVTAFTNALGRVTTLVSSTNKAETTKSLETLDTALDGITGAGNYSELKTSVDSILNSIKTAFTGITTPDNQQFDDKILKSFGADAAGDAKIKATDVLPGDKMFVVVEAKDTVTDDLKKLRMMRAVFANTKDKPREISSDAEATTLNTSQIAKLCDSVVDAAEYIVDFEKGWAKTDKAQERILKRIDELVKDASSEVKDADDESKGTEREVRTLASTATDFVKRAGGLPALVSGYAVPVYAATLNWCEGSMRNYKK